MEYKVWFNLTKVKLLGAFGEKEQVFRTAKCHDI